MAKVVYLYGHLVTVERKMIVTVTAIQTVFIPYQLVRLRHMGGNHGT